MKGLITVVVLIAVAAFALVKLKGSYEGGSFNPTEQGRETRATVEKCATWTEVLERAGEPTGWRDATSDFDFNYRDKFAETTRDTIAGLIKDNKVSYGFSFLYRFSDAVTFAVNFDHTGAMMNIQDREGQNALMDAAGG